jgi:hypothetical protein
MANPISRRRPNTSARAASSQDTSEGGNLPLQIRYACAECRRRKQKCTGDRPSCQFCAEKGQVCSYEVADGMTRSEDLKFKLREAIERRDQLDRLVGAMRRGTDQQSSELLARLRVGATLDDLLDMESRLDYLPEYIRNGVVNRSAWLESSSGESCLELPSVGRIMLINVGAPQTAAEGSRDVTSTPTTSPSYSFGFAMPPPRLSPQDIDQANSPFNQALSPFSTTPQCMNDSSNSYIHEPLW